MSERSARQRKFLGDARKTAQARLKQTLENPALDDEDISALFEIEVAKEVASAMFLGGLYGVLPGTSLEDYIRSSQQTDDRLKQKDAIIGDLNEKIVELNRKLYGGKQ